MKNDSPPGKPSENTAGPPAHPDSHDRTARHEVILPVELKVGLEGEFEADVPMEWTRAHFQKDFPAVFSTPAMIGMMESACTRAVTAMLPPGTLTVGTRIEVDHLKAAGLGAHVITTAKLAEINGRFLVFDVEAHWNGLLLGRGRITHAVVSFERFSRIGLGQTVQR